MSFKGETYRYAFSEGGFNGNDNYDLVPETAFSYPSTNLDLYNGLREKRGGSTKDNGTAITASPKCLGIGQWVSAGGTTMNILSAHSDGKVWKDQASAIATGMSQANRFDFCQAGTNIFICDGATAPQVWNGTSTATAITTSAADWSGTNQPKFMVLHSRGASRRLAAFGVGGNESAWYLSATGGSANAGYQDFSNTNVLKFIGDFGDGIGITGAVDFNQDLLVMGKKRALIFNDSDTSTANWGWQRAPWHGGVSHQKLLIKVENDVYAMMDDGDIYSIKTAFQTTDYKRASITRPASIHRYIANYVDLTKISEFHAIFDPTRRAILWFVVRKGQTTADTCLVFYIDRASDPQLGPAHAWSVWDGVDNTVSGLKATASVAVRNSDSSYSIKTGDGVGFIWTLGSTSLADDGNGYNEVLNTPWLVQKNPRNEKRYVSAQLVFVATGAFPLTVRWWVDNTEQAGIPTAVGGTGSVFPLTFDTSTFSAPGLNEIIIPLGQVGRRIMFQLSNNTAGQNIRMAELLLDYEDRGARYL